MSAAPLLSVERLSMRFGGLLAIDDLSLDVAARQITGVIGPNGAGKTTFFNCLTGFYKPSQGSVRLNHPQRGVLRLEQLASHQVARTAKVVRTFQNIRLFPKMTVLENLIVAQHNKLMQASGMTFLGLLGFPAYGRAEKQAMEQGGRLARQDQPDRKRRRAGRQPALWRAAAHRDRARHVHRPGAALPRRAGGGPQRHASRRR
jgi:branched-chain amino acid transport system ATP-binding protein